MPAGPNASGLQALGREGLDLFCLIALISYLMPGAQAA